MGVNGTATLKIRIAWMVLGPLVDKSNGYLHILLHWYVYYVVSCNLHCTLLGFSFVE